MDPRRNPADTLVEPSAPQPDDERELAERFRSLINEAETQTALAVLDQMHTADQGLSLLELNRSQRNTVLSLLEPQRTAHILDHLSPQETSQLAVGIDVDILSDILDASSPDVAADVLRFLPRQQSDQVRAMMSRLDAVSPLLQYPC